MTPDQPDKRILHLVRRDAEPLGVAGDDWIVYLDPSPELAPQGTPPLPPGPLDHDQLVTLVFAADLVVTW